MQQKIWNKNFILLSVMNFFLFACFFMLNASLSIFVVNTLERSTSEVGLVMSFFLGAALIVRPLIGGWLDGNSRRKILLFSAGLFAVSGLSYLSVLYFQSFELLLFIRIVHGISFGMLGSASNAEVSNVIPKEKKAEGIGYFALFMNVANVIGPVFGLFFLERDENLLFFSFSAIFAVLTFICLLPLVRKDSEKIKQLKVEVPKELSKKVRKKWVEPTILPIATVITMVGIGFSSISTLLSLYAKELGNISLASYFYFFMVAMMVLSRPFSGKLFDRRGANIVMYPSFFVYAIGVLLLSMATSSALFLFSGLIVGLGYAAIFPGLQTLTLKAAPVDRQGLAITSFFLFFDLGMTIGSSFFAFVTDMMGPGGMYAVCVITILISTGLYLLSDKYTSKIRIGKLTEKLQ